MSLKPKRERRVIMFVWCCCVVAIDTNNNNENNNNNNNNENIFYKLSRRVETSIFGDYKIYSWKLRMSSTQWSVIHSPWK